jgi:hypothetical protein
MVADLRRALAGLPVSPGVVLAGTYQSTDQARCDVENRLFTNLGASSFPKGLTGIRFERGVGLPSPPPVPVARVAGHLYYYRYRLGGQWQSWESAGLLARWHRVTRRLADDGSCRPVWLAMRLGVAAGQVEVLAPAPAVHTALGVRVVVHATSRGPRQAAAISETMIDGIIAAFHTGLGQGHASAAAAAALAPRMSGMSPSEVEALIAGSVPGPLFDSPAFTIKGSYVQISPSDDRCQAGEVTIQSDAYGQSPQISGELFALRPIAA